MYASPRLASPRCASSTCASPRSAATSACASPAASSVRGAPPTAGGSGGRCAAQRISARSANPSTQAFRDRAPSDSERLLSSSDSDGASLLGPASLETNTNDSFSSSSQRGSVGDEDGAARFDLEGLIDFLAWMQRHSAQFVEGTYIINNWALGGIIPMRHHGFIFKTSNGWYLTLDFSRRGIVWDTAEYCPDPPDRTILFKRYAINADPKGVRRYCEATKPFSWISNDCATWSSGLMQVVGMVDGGQPAALAHGTHGRTPLAASDDEVMSSPATATRCIRSGSPAVLHTNSVAVLSGSESHDSGTRAAPPCGSEDESFQEVFLGGMGGAGVLLESESKSVYEQCFFPLCVACK